MSSQDALPHGFDMTLSTQPETDLEARTDAPATFDDVAKKEVVRSSAWHDLGVAQKALDNAARLVKSAEGAYRSADDEYCAARREYLAAGCKTAHSTVVVFPDYQGRDSITGEFARTVQRVLSSTTVVAVINGDELPEVADDERTVHIHSSQGFNNAVLAGLERSVSLGDRVARIDTNEHSTALLEAAFNLLDDAEVAVVDVAFDQWTLIRGSAEDYHSRFVIPSIISQATDNRLVIGGNHGFMLYRSAALVEILPVVRETLKIANREQANAGRRSITWSADSLTPIVADRLGMRVTVAKQPARELRNNSAEKCATQAEDLLILLKVLDRLFLHAPVRPSQSEAGTKNLTLGYFINMKPPNRTQRSNRPNSARERSRCSSLFSSWRQSLCSSSRRSTAVHPYRVSPLARSWPS